MKLGDVMLASARPKGGGGFKTNDLTPILPTLGFTPNQITVYRASTLGATGQVSGVYSITQAAGQNISGASLTSGTDGPWAIGDLVLLQFVASAAGSGTVSNISVTTAGGVSGTVANPTTNAAISLSLTGITGDSTVSNNGVMLNVAASGIISPTIAANTNNWSPAGWLSTGVQTANVIRVNVTGTTPATNLLTGLVPPTAAEGSLVTIQNLSTSVNTLHFVANSASSTAANRFNFLSDIWVDPGDSVQLIYDATAAEWREYGPHKDFRGDIWGSGYDGVGPVTNTTFARDMYFTDWVVPANIAFVTAGFRTFVNGTLDLSNASAGAIVWNGNTGTIGTQGGAGGAGGTAANGLQLSLGLQTAGGAGGAGSTTNGSVGSASTTRVIYNAVNAGNGGAGGAGGTGNGGAVVGGVAAIGAASYPVSVGGSPVYNVNSVSTFVAAGQSGSGGSGGGGDGANSGGGGGGGGCCGGTGLVTARKINMGANATVGILAYKGGVGGAGGAGAAVGNTGGGGGGGGGQGGVCLIIHGGRFGTGGTNAIDVTGGNGGNGGALHGTGNAANGNGGGSGPSGSFLVYDTRVPLASANWAVGTASVAHNGSTGGVALVTQANI